MGKSLPLIVKNRTQIRDRETFELAEYLRSRLIGQDEALQEIVPYLEMHQVNLSPVGRPAGVFLLLGPTGTGKTRTAEVVAEALHGSDRQLLRIDCGEYQLDHEVAKLVGAPPGYLGHRETQAVLTQQRLESVTSEDSALSVVLFDEIEKAAPSMTRILLGILDKAFLRTGDNNPVNFENSIIFLSSNLGAREMAEQLRPHMGFHTGNGEIEEGNVAKMRETAMHAVRKRFAPEFLNRVDASLIYRPLNRESLGKILDQQLEALQALVDMRMGLHTFYLEYTQVCRDFLVDRGFQPEFGGRELKRTIQRWLLQPLASLVARKRIPAGRRVEVDYDRETETTTFRLMRS